MCHYESFTVELVDYCNVSLKIFFGVTLFWTSFDDLPLGSSARSFVVCAASASHSCSSCVGMNFPSYRAQQMNSFSLFSPIIQNG